VIAVFSRAGREELTARTLALLAAAGASTSDRVLWWSGEVDPPVIPSSWRVDWRRGPPRGPVADWFEFIKTAAGRGDLHVFEDDVIPCRNLIPYIERTPVEWFTTYFNPWGAPVGRAFELRGGLGFDCSQAISIPARLVDRLAAAPDYAGPLGHDCIMSRLLASWNEPVLWDRTLVQHVAGNSSNGRRREFWLRDGKWVGADFDALTIPTRQAAPGVWTGGYFLGVRPAVDLRSRPRPGARMRRW